MTTGVLIFVSQGRFDTMESRKEDLKSVSLFSSLSDPDLERLAAIAIPRKYRKNKVLFRQGDPGNVLFILTEGEVKVSLLSSNGKEVILKMMFAKDFFGEMSLLDGKFRSATVTTVTPCETLIIERADFTRLIGEYPEFVLEILATLNRRLRNSTKQISNITFFDAYGKVAQLLLNLVEEYGRDEGDSIVLIPKYSRQEMAGMAGLTRETFTRVLHEFQERDYLVLEGKKILIAEKELLKREVI